MNQPKVIIGNQFWREEELLLLKLEEIDLQLGRQGIDWKMVVVESDHTFTGTPKPYHLNQFICKPEFKKFDSKIHRIKLKGFGNDAELDSAHAMKNDFIQKRAVADGFRQLAGPDDVCVLCDLDEIPDFRSILWYFGGDLNRIDKIYTLVLKLFYYSYNNLAMFNDDRVTIFKMKDFKGVDEHRAGLSMGVPRIWIPNGGWHFSYLGNIDVIRNKIENFGHSELNTPEVMDNLASRVSNGVDPYGRPGCDFKVVEITDKWPEMIYNNQERYIHNISKVEVLQSRPRPSGFDGMIAGGGMFGR